MAFRSNLIEIRRAGTKIAGIQSKTATVNKEGVDITSDDDSLYRTFLGGGSGSKSIEFAADGVSKDDVLRDIAFNPATDNLLTNVTMHFEDGKILTCDWLLQPFVYKGEMNGAIMFECTFSSSGAWTWTDAP